MSNHSLSSLMGLVTDESTGRVLAGRVCGHCAKEGQQMAFVASYLCKVMRCNDISVGICPAHYQAEIAKLTGDRSEMSAISA